MWCWWEGGNGVGSEWHEMPFSEAVLVNPATQKEVNMSIENYQLGEISSLGKAIYQSKIKHLVEPQENGKFIVIDVESGDYEIDEQDVVASSRLRERRPNAVTYGVLIGYRAAYSLGGKIETTDD